MQAPLRACFSDLPTVDMKEILQQWMFKNQLLSDLDEARQKKRKIHEVPKTPSRSPPPQLLPPPPPAGASGAPGTSEASRSSQLPRPPLTPSTSTSGSTQQPSSEAPSSSKSAASAPYSMAWTISNTKYESAGIFETQELSPMDSSIQDDSIPDEQIHLSDDEDSRNDHLPKFQMKECHKLLIYQVDWTNLKGDQVRVDVNRPLPLGGPSAHVTIQSKFFFNKDLEYLRHGIKGSSLTLSISKIKAASYPDFGHLDYLPGFDKRMLSTAVKLWTRNLVIRQRVEDFQIGIESYQTHLNPNKPKWDAIGYEFNHDYTIIESPRAVVFPVNNNKRKIMRFNEIYKFSDGTLTWILEALAYRVKEFKIKRLNPGMNTHFWT
nr:hypothetical protein [Tanacetum cinerariifolium]